MKRSKTIQRLPLLILASGSPRRAELLRQAGYKFSIIKSHLPELSRRPQSVPIKIWPVCLALHKASAVASKLKHPAIVLGADTIVVLDDKIINKARNRAHAREILWSLSGKKHQVITGIALVKGDACRLAVATSICRMKKLSSHWLQMYLDSGLWKGKAGAYGIQDYDDPMVELISGEWTNVVGLPMGLLGSELNAFQKQP
ncbi:MAG TPA: nucleoside triphosphate pyrophosphatase [Phycisphaerae bacterium]|nr:nucleoside triphosphate pyrophosphatase [Phycisphaerae bacterium]